MNRRQFIQRTGVVLAAPAIVRFDSLDLLYSPPAEVADVTCENFHEWLDLMSRTLTEIAHADLYPYRLGRLMHVMDS